MPGWNTTVQDYSPLISYSPFGAWGAGSNSSDQFYGYYNDGYTSSSTINATASFQFTGSGIWIYGARRPNHGAYMVTLDGVASTYTNTPTTDLFQTVLFGASGLSNDTHTVELVNLGGNPSASSVDIDFITCEHLQSEDENLLQQMYVDPTSLQWVYNGDWTMEGAASNSVIHSNSPNATATLQFGGDHVDIYGRVGPSCGSFLVSLDGESDSRTFNCNNSMSRSQVLLYSADAMQNGNHFLRVTNLALAGQSTLYLEHAVMITSRDASRENQRPPPFEPPGSGQIFSKDARIALIVAFGVVVPLVGIICTILCLRRRRHFEEILPHDSKRVSLEAEQWNGKSYAPLGHPMLHVVLPSSSTSSPISPTSPTRTPSQYGVPIVRAKSSPSRIAPGGNTMRGPAQTRGQIVPWLVIPTMSEQMTLYDSSLSPVPLAPSSARQYQHAVERLTPQQQLPPGFGVIHEANGLVLRERNEKRRRDRMSHPPPPNYWQATARSP